MFDSKKFDAEYYDFHCKELARILIRDAFRDVQYPAAWNFDVSDEKRAEVKEQERAAWFKSFRVPLKHRMVILDCRNNDLFNGCLCVPQKRFSGRFEEFEILYDAGDEMTLADLARGLTLDDGTILKPEIEVGDVKALEERLAARIKSACDDRLGEYFTWIVGGGAA